MRETVKSVFDSAMGTIKGMLPYDDRLRSQYRLVHAICKDKNGEQYAHAWVEVNKFCIYATWKNDVLEPVRVPVKSFYKAVKPMRLFKYTPNLMDLMQQRYLNSGPWEKELRALCKGNSEPSENGL